MSTTMIAIGYIAVLADPVSKDERDSEADRLYDEHKLGLNYEGALVYSLDTNKESCDFDGLQIVQPDEGRHKLFVAAAKAGLSVKADTAKPYFCYWYTGGDNPLNTLTAEEFLEG